MSIGRRKVLGLALATAATGFIQRSAIAAPPQKIKAIAFDAFPIFDPRPVYALGKQLFPGKGAELGNAWRGRQFEYQWLRGLGGHYVDFWHATDDAPVYAAKATRLDLTPDKRKQLMNAFLELRAWPDVAPQLQAFKKDGMKLAFLSNATQKILDAGIRNSGLDGAFDAVVSTDAIKSYKPDPRAYQMGVDALKLKRDEILFVAFAGWDVAGAKWFGYPTYWMNRLNAPVEELDATPDGTGTNLNELAAFLEKRSWGETKIGKTHPHLFAA
jgi:2-haloacid dehalogenase